MLSLPLAYLYGDNIVRGIKGDYQSDEDYFAGQVYRSLPIIGGIIQANDSLNYYSDYNKNRGIKWTDYKYGKGPSMSGAVGGVTSVSKNILSLYD